MRRGLALLLFLLLPLSGVVPSAAAQSVTPSPLLSEGGQLPKTRITSGILAGNPHEAFQISWPKKYKTCIDLRKFFRYGVAKAIRINNKGVSPIYSPAVNTSVYLSNVKLDLDKDGIACEVVDKSKTKVTSSSAESLPGWYLSASPAVKGKSSTYLTFDNDVLPVVSWMGRSVALQTADIGYDPVVIGRILKSLDLAYLTYQEITGFTPIGGATIDGRLSVAVIPQGFKTCGAGCAYLGANGIQVTQEFFDKLYFDVRDRNQFDQVLFYELGRNFWNPVWTNKLAFKERDSVVTGFAVLMRFVAMNQNDIPIASFGSQSGAEFLSTVEHLASIYLSSEKNTFSSTFAIERSPGTLGTTDLWASLMMRWAKENGGAGFYGRFFQNAHLLQDADTTQSAVQNWLKALNRASGKDYSIEFFGLWRLNR